MTIDPEALQRAMRAQFPAPELAPEASDWMREIVAAVGSNPFVHRERDVLKLVEAPLKQTESRAAGGPAGFRLRGAQRDCKNQFVSLEVQC